MAFFSTCVHRVLPVQRGARLSLVYNLYAEVDSDSEDDIASCAMRQLGPQNSSVQALLAGSLRQALFSPVLPARPLCIILGHEYAASSSLHSLLGADRMLLEVLHDMHLKVKLQPVVVEQFYLEDIMMVLDEEEYMNFTLFCRPTQMRNVGTRESVITGPSPMNVTLVPIQQKPLGEGTMFDRYVGNSAELPCLQYCTMAMLVMHPEVTRNSWLRCRGVFLAAMKGDQDTLLRRLWDRKPSLVKLIAQYLAPPRGKVLRLP